MGTAWQDKANCKGRYDLVFIERGNPYVMATKLVRARKMCEECPVKKECLEYALDNPADSKIGIWGGTTERERRKLRKAKRSRLVPV